MPAHLALQRERVEVEQLGGRQRVGRAEHVGERGHRDLRHEAGRGRRVRADRRRAERDDVGRVGQRDLGAVQPRAQRARLDAPVAERAAVALVAQDEPLAERELERAAPVGQLLEGRREHVLVGELGQQLGDELAVDLLPALARERVDERAGHAAWIPPADCCERAAAAPAPAGAPKV